MVDFFARICSTRGKKSFSGTHKNTQFSHFPLNPHTTHPLIFSFLFLGADVSHEYDLLSIRGERKKQQWRIFKRTSRQSEGKTLYLQYQTFITSAHKYFKTKQHLIYTS